MSTLWGREPAMIVGLVVAGLNVLTALGVEISDALNGAIVQLVVALITVLSGVWVVRRAVTSPATLSANYVPKSEALLNGYQPRHDRD